MTSELADFHQEFFQDVIAAAQVGSRYAEDAFFDILCNQLVEAGDLETADRAYYASSKGLRVDGYGGDPRGSDGVLSLLVSDFSQSPDVGTLTRTEIEALFKRLSNFVRKSLDDRFRNGLEESTPAFGLADLIAARWRSLAKIRLIVISNRVISSRVDGLETQELESVPTTRSVWDLSRLHRYAESGSGREDILIDLGNTLEGALAALPAHLDDAGYESYLLVVPGSQLAAIYDRWGARLLEQNVRVFLQARGNVNKGIRNTIENHPEMFFAYNNGVTATAESVDFQDVDGVRLITGLKNFQIVNGGQTTASLHAASRKLGADLSGVFVQMKLSIVEPGKSLEIVPKISEYANTQNRVSAADFFANHPFHIRMEGFSRRVYAPSPDGTFHESKWFYERARGQYQDARGYLTSSQRRTFDLEYPKRQVFSKTDLAKFLVAWDGRPDIVSRGAQKNFAAFAMQMGREWSKRADEFNEEFYRQAIAKAIIFHGTETLVSEQEWYQGGYRANVVAYAIAKLSRDVSTMGRALDFGRIWREQRVGPRLREALTLAATSVHDVIIAPPSSMRNVTEWAKQQACWSRAEELSIAWPVDWTLELLTKDEEVDTRRNAVNDQRVLNGIEAQTAVYRAGPENWAKVIAWGAARRLLTEKDSGILDVCASMPDRLPSEKQSTAALGILRRLQGEGCPLMSEMS